MVLITCLWLAVVTMMFCCGISFAILRLLVQNYPNTNIPAMNEHLNDINWANVLSSNNVNDNWIILKEYCIGCPK